MNKQFISRLSAEQRAVLSKKIADAQRCYATPQGKAFIDQLVKDFSGDVYVENSDKTIYNAGQRSVIDDILERINANLGEIV